MAKKLVKYCVVDAFTETAFKGNPAAVCWLEGTEKDDKWLQSVATEFNLSQTGFLTPIIDHGSENPRFKLRWFTPVTEVQLCGHATLAASHFLFEYGLVKFNNTIEFSTLSGILTAKKVPERRIKDSSVAENGEAQIQSNLLIELNFPVVAVSDFNDLEVSAISEILNGVSIVDLKKIASNDILRDDIHPMETNEIDENNSFNESNYFFDDTSPFETDIHPMDTNETYENESLNESRYFFDDTSPFKTNKVVLPSGKEVVDFEPQLDKIKKAPGRGIIITGLAPNGSGFDFYSRFFCPKYGIDEDPICGSAHCALAAYWSDKLGKFDFLAYQASPRSGILDIHLDKKNQRVLIRGKAITVMEGSLLV